ncbi:TIGR01906 family membrane protein [Ureaplasma canigenitalium]|uniref:TIGR01906 family membrane protein n=1 Tax=Ureaplasma canigenitalium TaxID=42092 RepID=UPI0006923687|nr:TIGR01906 family membrane protein [Ureaplasma canigenitalium]
MKEKKQNKTNPRDKAIAFFLTLSIMLFIISFSISLPILIRPFYYYHLNNLDINSLTFKAGKLDYGELKRAYDELLDYLTLGGSFKMGQLKYSIPGMEHFVDVKNLFTASFTSLGISSVLSFSLILTIKLKKYQVDIIKIGFIASIILFLIIIIIGILVSINFDRAFEVFHTIFFPGKDNYDFNGNVDEIIKILPTEFFLNVSIFIGVLFISLCLFFIIYQIINYAIKKRKEWKLKDKEKEKKIYNHRFFNYRSKLMVEEKTK